MLRKKETNGMQVINTQYYGKRAVAIMYLIEILFESAEATSTAATFERECADW